MIFDQTHYRDFLKEMLAERTRQNPQYSMRSLARHLKIQPSLLSEILRGNRNLTEETAMKIADRLELNELEREYLRLLVQLERAKTPSLKESVLAAIRRIHPQPNTIQDLNVDLFRVIADWYHFAILRLTEIDEFQWSETNVAKMLGIPEYDVEKAIQRLLRLELIELDSAGRPYKVSNDLLVRSELPNSALQKYHAQMLDKTKDALREQSPAERFTGTEDIVLDSSQINEASVIFEEAFRKVLDLSKSKKKKKSPEVFHLGIHLFKLTQIHVRKEKEVRK